MSAYGIRPVPGCSHPRDDDDDDWPPYQCDSCGHLSCEECRREDCDWCDNYQTGCIACSSLHRLGDSAVCSHCIDLGLIHDDKLDHFAVSYCVQCDDFASGLDRQQCLDASHTLERRPFAQFIVYNAPL